MGISLLYLVGFMGSGKTSVGGRLAELLEWQFVDLDRRIVEREETPISEIFRRHGEELFRRIETEELRKVSRESRTVVALGGGAFCSTENQRIVRETGASVWLDAPLNLLVSRCAPDGSRPLFTNRSAMRELLRRRRPYYRMADVRIRVGRLSVDEIAARIRDDLVLPPG